LILSLSAFDPEEKLYDRGPVPVRRKPSAQSSNRRGAQSPEKKLAAGKFLKTVKRRCA
jgi:hypothetical protein